MAGENRYLAGKTNVMKVPIRGQTIVNPGDFVIINKTHGGLMGSGRSIDYYGYPFGDMTTSSPGHTRGPFAYHNFAGVALGGSISGVTEEIGVATTGQFRYPLQTQQGGVTTSNVTAGMRVSASSAPRDQQVAPGSSTVSMYVGYCTKTQSGASFVDLFIRPAYGPAGNITQ